MLDWDEIEREVEELLQGLDELHLDRERIEQFAAEIAAGRLGPERNRFAQDPEPAAADDVDVLDRFSSAERERYEGVGAEALARGEVAVAVLNGGMATRFGGVVKGVVEAVAGRSFLEIKWQQARRRGPVPFLVMNSFATHRETRGFLERSGLGAAARTFLQSVSLRLTPKGDVFRDAGGAVSLYAPGHGDFPDALRRSGLLAELAATGVRALLLSNVDNLGAEPDPVVIGYHLCHGRPLTCEVAEARGGDVGGTPALVEGRVQVVEGFRFSPRFDFSRLHFLSTNTFCISLAALEDEYPLTWFYVEKTVDGRPAIQMERLVNELSRFVETAFLATPRGGASGRFFPVKTPADLETLRRDPVLAARFGRA